MHYEITTVGPIDRDYLTEVVLAFMAYTSYLPPQRKNVVPPLGSMTRTPIAPLLRPPVPALSPFRTSFAVSSGRRLASEVGPRTGPPLTLQLGIPIQLKPNITLRRVSDLGRGLQDLFFWQGPDRMYLLSVSSRGAHYHWERLRLNWNNEDFAFALPVDLSQVRRHREADIRTLAAMSRSEKIVEALYRSKNFVGGEALSVLEAMISPQAIGYLLAIETAYAISLAFGVGEVATGLLLVAGVVFVGQEVLVLIEELVAFVEAASDARTSADLDQAAKHMATALTLGLDIVVALLLRRRGRKAQGPEVVVRAKSGGAGGRRNSSVKGSSSTGGQTPGSVGGGGKPSSPANNKPKPKKKGKAKNKLEPDPNTKGDHTTFERDNNGDVYKYETYEKTPTGHDNPRVRFDGGKPDGSPGNPHRDKSGNKVETPHVQGKSVPEGARKPKPDEYPNNKRFPKKQPKKP